MNKTQQNILKIAIIMAITATVTAALLRIWRTPSQPQQVQDFAYWVTVEEDLRINLAKNTTAINQQIAQFESSKRELIQQIEYAREQKNSLRVQDVPLAFH